MPLSSGAILINQVIAADRLDWLNRGRPAGTGPGVWMSELVNIRLGEVDLDRCRIRIKHGKGDKDRVVPFPEAFEETLGMRMDKLRETGGVRQRDRSLPYLTLDGGWLQLP